MTDTGYPGAVSQHKMTDAECPENLKNKVM